MQVKMNTKPGNTEASILHKNKFATTNPKLRAKIMNEYLNSTSVRNSDQDKTKNLSPNKTNDAINKKDFAQTTPFFNSLKTEKEKLPSIRDDMGAIIIGKSALNKKRRGKNKPTSATNNFFQH